MGIRSAGGFNPFPTLLAVRLVGSGEAQSEACMALPGPSKGLAVATVTYYQLKNAFPFSGQVLYGTRLYRALGPRSSSLLDRMDLSRCVDLAVRYL